MLYKWCVLCIPIGSSVEKTLCYLSLGTSTRIQVWKERRRKWNSVGWSVHPGCAPHNTNIYYIWEREANEWEKWTTKSPQHLILSISSVPVPCQNNRAASPCLSQEANMLSSINQTQSIDGYLANRSTNELRFDRYGILKSVNDVLSQEKSIFRYS